MSFHIDRKLISESLDNPTSKTCSSYCNPEVYHSIVCPLRCFNTCPRICLLPEFEPSPPSSPPPNFTPKVTLPHSPNKHTVSILLILLISVLGIAVYIFCAYAIHKFHNSRTSSQPEQQVGGGGGGEEEFSDIQTVGLQQSVISAITIHKYKKGEGIIEGTECSVCLSEFQEDETLRILPNCNHAFHIPCIDTWLESHINCPMCRADIIITIPATLEVCDNPMNIFDPLSSVV